MEFRRVDIKTGYTCNNNCKFCVQAHNRQYGNKSTAEIKKALVDAKENNCQGVVFTGGEFTVRKDCFDLVKYAKEQGFESIQLQSNGRMFSSMEFCKRMIKAGANEFSPALHGHRAEVHDYLTSSPGAFNQTVQGIKNLRKLRQYLVMNSVIVKPNYRYAPQLAKLLCELGVNQFQFAFVHAIGNAENNFESMIPYKTLAMPYLKKGIDIAKKYNVFAMIEAVPYCMMSGYEKHCSELYIPFTRIEEHSFVIDNFKEIRTTQGKAKAEKCRKCRFDLICEGPWKEYPEHFGWDEFIPIPGEKIKSPEEILSRN